MVVEQGPGIAVGFGFCKESTEAGEKLHPVFIVKEDRVSLNASDDNVLKQSGGYLFGHVLA